MCMTPCPNVRKNAEYFKWCVVLQRSGAVRAPARWFPLAPLYIRIRIRIYIYVYA